MLTIIYRRFRQHPGAIFGLTTLIVLVVVMTLAPLSPYDPERNHILEKLQTPSVVHPAGTDALGRDVLTRTLYGGRLSLFIGIGAMIVSLAVGVPIGAISGFYGGRVDSILMRTTDMFLAFPSIFVLILFSAMLREANLPYMSGGHPLVIILAIGLLSWMALARLVRSSFLSLRKTEFVVAAFGLGGSNFHLITQHLLPNVVGPIIVALTLIIAHALLIEAGLSFIGFGVHPRTPTWGNMLNDARSQTISHPWIALLPGLMLFITVIAINYVGDGLRDAFDPRSNYYGAR